MTIINETFAANTGQFSPLAYNNNSVFTVGGGVCHIQNSTGGVGQGKAAYCHLGMPLPAGMHKFTAFISIDIDPTKWVPDTTGGTYQNYAIGIGNPASAQSMFFEMHPVKNGVTVGFTNWAGDLLTLFGGQQNFAGGSPTVIDASQVDGMGILFDGNACSCWLRFNGVWSNTPSAGSDTMYPNVHFDAYNTDLTGWYVCFGAFSESVEDFYYTGLHYDNTPTQPRTNKIYDTVVLADNPALYAPCDDEYFVGGAAPNAALWAYDVIGKRKSLWNAFQGNSDTIPGQAATAGLVNSMGQYYGSGGSGFAWINPFSPAHTIPASTGVPRASFEAWINADVSQANSAAGTGLSANQAILFSDVSGTFNGDFAVGFAAGYVVTFGYGTNAGDQSITDTLSVNDGAWHHVVCTWDSVSGAVQLWIDNVLRQTGTGAQATAITGNGTVWSGKNGYSWAGRIAGYAIYPSVLTPTQIATHYTVGNSGGSTIPDVTGLSLVSATVILVTAGFTVGTLTTTVAPTTPPGDVVTQSPAGGSLALPGAAVNLTLATGGTIFLGGKFVPAIIGRAIMTADPGNIHPRIYPPQRDTTVRIK